MNLLTSYNWMKQYYKTKLSAEDFAREFSLRSMSIEEIISLEEKYKGIIIGQVEEVLPHPNADKLKIAKTNIGSETVEIVCGGKNLESGQKVIVALPGSMVKWHGEDAWTQLKPTKIRDIASHGMICAPEELDLAKVPCGDHDIWDVTNLIDSPAGTSFAEAFFDNDILFDMEVTTNRPDSMNIIGLAREAGVVSNEPFTWTPSSPPVGNEKLPLSVNVDDTDLCPRYLAIVIDNVKVAPSPAWLQARLLASGHRPINNIVDITNYILHEYGQPLHAFDYDKIEDAQINIRPAKQGEKIIALDYEEYELSDKNLVIADSKNPVAVAGVMGGLHSGTTENTTRIVLESATFDPISVRKTARALNLYSDSQSMFEKGLSTESTLPALSRAVEMILELAGGEVASELIDTRDKDYKPLVFTLKPARIRQQIGVDISDENQVEILEKLGFTLERDGDNYQVTVPYWRDHDIENDVDLTEEIARMYGYANIEGRMPVGEIPLVQKDKALIFENQLKQNFKNLGFTEFFSFSFTNATEIENYDLKIEDSIQIHNPLTADITHMRTSLIPSVLTSLSENISHTKTGKVFELARVYIKRENDLPLENSHLVALNFGYSNALSSFREMKGVLDHIFYTQGLVYSLSRANIPHQWHQTRTASIEVDGQIIGYIGEISHDIKENFDLQDINATVLQLDLSLITDQAEFTRSFTPYDESTKIARDISFIADKKLEFASLINALKNQSSIQDLNLIDIYQGQGIADDKQSITIRLSFGFSKTPTSEEIEQELKQAQQTIADSFNAEIR